MEARARAARELGTDGYPRYEGSGPVDRAEVGKGVTQGGWGRKEVVCKLLHTMNISG